MDKITLQTEMDYQLINHIVRFVLPLGIVKKNNVVRSLRIIGGKHPCWHILIQLFLSEPNYVASEVVVFLILVIGNISYSLEIVWISRDYFLLFLSKC